MWPKVIRTARRVFKPIVPRRLIEYRRSRIRRRQEPINAAIAGRLEVMLTAERGELLAMAPVSLSARAADAIARTAGRFEDVCFSPGGTRLALAAFEASRIIILRVEVRGDGAKPEVTVDHEVSIASRHIRHPHGVAFVDDDTLVVASRAAGAAVFRVPGSPRAEEDLEPVHRFGGSGLRFRYSPGSVDVEPRGDTARILVCDNDTDLVTAHTLTTGGEAGRTELIGRGLHVPDGIAVSRDGGWIAVSNHGSGVINLYRNTPELDRATEPTGVLAGLACPHGLRFLRSGTGLVAADAAGPWVHVYSAPDGDWSGRRAPVRTVRTLDEETWRRGHQAPGEGGPKGLAIDPDERVVVTTCIEQPLGVFALDAILAGVVR